MIAIDYTSRQPITAQIRDQMVRLITSGALKPGIGCRRCGSSRTDLSINPNTLFRRRTAGWSCAASSYR